MTEYYAILATDCATGRRFQCFTWRGTPEAGIAHAKYLAKRHGMECRDFVAEPLPHLM